MTDHRRSTRRSASSALFALRPSLFVLRTRLLAHETRNNDFPTTFQQLSSDLRVLSAQSGQSFGYASRARCVPTSFHRRKRNAFVGPSVGSPLLSARRDESRISITWLAFSVEFVQRIDASTCTAQTYTANNLVLASYRSRDQRGIAQIGAPRRLQRKIEFSSRVRACEESVMRHRVSRSTSDQDICHIIADKNPTALVDAIMSSRPMDAHNGRA